MAVLIDRTGQTFRYLKIIKELGRRKVQCICIKCGHEDDYDKGNVIKMTVTCKKCRVGNLFQDKTGETFRNLKIIQELGKGKVLCKCIKCNNEDTYIKGAVINNELLCKKCNAEVKDKTGKTYKELQIIKELGKNIVTCKCIKCQHEDNYNKQSVTQGKTKCKKCGISSIKDKSGQTYKDLKVIEELGGNKVICKCIICGHQDKYEKGVVIRHRSACSNCGINQKFKGRIVNNITIINLAYIGRDKNKYYNCICNECNKKLVLTREEIIKYICNEKR